MRKNLIYYKYTKLSYFTKDCFSGNIIRKKYINTILRDNSKV